MTTGNGAAIREESISRGITTKIYGENIGGNFHGKCSIPKMTSEVNKLYVVIRNRLKSGHHTATFPLQILY